jgi:hypothetical protein
LMLRGDIANARSQLFLVRDVHIMVLQARTDVAFETGLSLLESSRGFW